ncbi:MAG: hypothetical protein EOL93_00605 [Epsilonproteobacteria bacterium]|nr:hypothetical protein [Campylobacterota bacterium]
MLNSSQKEYVIKRLMEDGQISRNHCLSHYISRLGAIICDLKKDGFEISGDYEKVGNGKDFVYRLLNAEQLKSQGNCTTNADSLQEVSA